MHRPLLVPSGPCFAVACSVRVVIASDGGMGCLVEGEP